MFRNCHWPEYQFNSVCVDRKKGQWVYVFIIIICIIQTGFRYIQIPLQFTESMNLNVKTWIKFDNNIFMMLSIIVDEIY